MTVVGTSIDPAVSRDGKLLAYSTPAGGEAAHIWLRSRRDSSASTRSISVSCRARPPLRQFR